MLAYAAFLFIGRGVVGQRPTTAKENIVVGQATNNGRRNLDFGSISCIESGQKNSYLLTLKTIADALKLDVRDFL